MIGGMVLNLRDFSNSYIEDNYKTDKQVLLFINAFILLVILVIVFFVYGYFEDIAGVLVVSGILLYFWFLLSKEIFGALWSAVFSPENNHVKHAICHHCFKNINLVAEANEAWICNFCSENIPGNVLDPCPKCQEEQRTFMCPFCESIFDIDAYYSEKQLKEKRYNEQSKLIRG